MNTPVPALMKCYGTEDIFQEKLANGASGLLARLGMGILDYHLVEGGQEAMAKQRAEEALMHEATREHALAQMRLAAEPLRGEGQVSHVYADLGRGYNENTSPRFRREVDALLSEGGYTLPASLSDAGMTRLASIAAAAGADLAKEAGVGVPSGNLVSRASGALKGKLGLGWKGQALLGAGAIGAGVLATKGGQKLQRYAAKEPEGPAVFGMGKPSGNIGYQIPMGVNQYGQPEVGTPLF